MGGLIRKFRRLRTLASGLETSLDLIRINQGRLLAAANEKKSSLRLQDYEFRVFSQWGEDGIIQRLTSMVPIENRTFIEFGVEDFFESNCRFVMTKDNWSGFVVDSSDECMLRLRSSYFYWMHDLQSVMSFITRENVNDVLAASGFGRDLGILSVDVDGMDYWILEAISSFIPRIIIVEYNSIFGPTRKISVPYQPDFLRAKRHYSNLYFGASLSAFAYLLENRGYALVGTASAGGNAFFVRRELLPEQLPAATVSDAFTISKARESRDKSGRLSYLTGAARAELIRGLEVVNVETGAREVL